MAYNQNYSQRSNDEVHFDLMEHIGVLGRKDNGWTKEVNIVAWNGGKAKVDIRDWDPDHERMSKGITLFEEEAETLVKALAHRYGLRYTKSMSAGTDERHGQPVREAVSVTAPAAETAENPASESAEASAPASAETLAAAAEQEEEIPFESAGAADPAPEEEPAQDEQC